jgi:hypothetical protein
MIKKRLGLIRKIKTLKLIYRWIATLEGATTFSIMTLSITTYSIKGLLAPLSIRTFYYYAEYRYAECNILFTVMPGVIMLSVVKLYVVMLSVVMMNA